MIILTIFIGVVLWVVVGACGFVFWWTKQYDFTKGELLLCFYAGVMVGPLAWLVGWIVHSEPKDCSRGGDILIKKRK
jgi:hypothetical protein